MVSGCNQGAFRASCSHPTNPSQPVDTKMKTLRFLLPLAVLIGAIPMMAQQAQPMPMPAKKGMGMAGRISPHETVGRVIDGNRVTIVYGRPYSKDPKSAEIRKIWGTLVPYDHWWRLGSDEATLLVTQKAIVVGGLSVPAGAHTLFLLPAADGSAKLIVSNQLGQWGLQYDAAQDLGRVDMTKSELPKQLDQFTMAVDRNPDGGGLLSLSWETTKYSVAFTVVK